MAGEVGLIKDKALLDFINKALVTKVARLPIVSKSLDRAIDMTVDNPTLRNLNAVASRLRRTASTLREEDEDLSETLNDLADTIIHKIEKLK